MAHTWNDSRVTTIFQLAKCHGLVMYTRGAADASEQMLSANIKLWKGPASSMLLGWACVRQPHECLPGARTAIVCLGAEEGQSA